MRERGRGRCSRESGRCKRKAIYVTERERGGLREGVIDGEYIIGSCICIS